MDQPLQRIRDISPETCWPQHLTDLICRRKATTNVIESSQNDLHIKLDEIAACICHVAMIEIGFVPSFIQVDATQVRFMTERERIVSLSSEIPSQLRNSNTGIITVTYRAIQENPKNLITHTFRRDVENQESETVVEHGRVEQMELSPEETEPLYIYTNPVNVIMLAQNGVVSLHGHIKCNDTISDSQTHAQPQSVHLDVNIRDYLPPHCSVKNFDVNALLPSQQWLNQIQLDGSRISDTLKIKFSKVLLTLVDGISFEPSLQHLSPELLVKVFDFLPIVDVCHTTQVSHYMFAVSDSEVFWMQRIERDFPADARAIRARFSSSDKEGGSAPTKEPSSTSTISTTTSTNTGSGEESVYREYIRLYNARRPPRRRFLHQIYRRGFIPRRSFTPLLGLHPPLLRRFW